jgi:hypothetical protein
VASEKAHAVCLKTYADTEQVLRIANLDTDLVNEEVNTPALQPEHLPLFSRFSDLFSGILDSFSFLFFCLSFSSLTHLFTSWCSRFLAEE